MISDDELYRLAIFLGSAAMLLIILYHILEVNAVEEPKSDSKTGSISQDSKANVGHGNGRAVVHYTSGDAVMAFKV
ncbi:Oligosaccaryltransferase protein [Rutstroemia sp. NJR-2017a WRK4]|nr:Oligosaccaryltransferase protein [Rutstroemia sp. NJR-2017a WRK4]